MSALQKIRFTPGQRKELVKALTDFHQNSTAAQPESLKLLGDKARIIQNAWKAHKAATSNNGAITAPSSRPSTAGVFNPKPITPTDSNNSAPQSPIV